MQIGHKKLSKFVIFNVIAVLIIASALAAEFPVPHSINGFVYSADTGEMVAKDTPFSINNTNNGFFVEGTTGRKPHPSGRYSAAVNGNDGDVIVIRTWNSEYGSERTILLNGTMSNINVYLKTEITNIAPVITSTPITNAMPNQLYLYDVEAYDENGDTLSYSLNIGPEGMSINAASGLIQWIPNHTGNYSIEISVSDGKNETIQSYILFVGKVNSAPVVTSMPILSAVVNVEYNYNVEASDIDGDILSYALATSPEGMTINQSNGIIKWIPTETQLGANYVSVVVSDGELSTQQNFTINVGTTQNNPPIITSTPIKTATQGIEYNYDVDATDSDNDALTYALLTYPIGMKINNATGLITWTPNATQVNSYDVNIIVYDSKGASALQWYVLTVANVNDAPIIISEPLLTAKTGELYQYDVNAIDYDNDVLTYSLKKSPRTMQIDPSTGLITWKPKLSDIGENSVIVNVSDGILYAQQSFVINVSRSTKLRWFRVTLSIAGHSGARIEVNNSESGFYYDAVADSENTLVLVNGMDGDHVKVKAYDPTSYGETEFDVEEDMPAIPVLLNNKLNTNAENPSQNITNMTQTANASLGLIETPINKSNITKTIRLNFRTAVSEVHYTVRGAEDAGLEVEEANGSYAPIEKGIDVYQYLKMKLKNTRNIEVEGSATVIFKVDKKWVEREGIPPEKILLYRFSNGWTRLNTSLVFDDLDNYFYKSATPGFSLFAIAGEKSEGGSIEESNPAPKAPTGISGYIYKSDGKTQIDSGTSFRITNLRTKQSVSDKTGVASFGGRYSVLLDGADEDELLLQINERAPYSEGRVILNGDRDNVNFIIKGKSLVPITGAQTIETTDNEKLTINIITILVLIFIVIAVTIWPIKRKPKEKVFVKDEEKIEPAFKEEKAKPAPKEEIKQATISKIMKKIPESQYFYLAGGGVLKNLVELAEALNKMSDGVFRNHVSDSKNDFANWINDVWEDKTLASLIRGTKDRVAMGKILTKYLKK
jgi:PGF-pre-PGF domain-containing protein